MTAKEFFLAISDLDLEIDRKLKKLGEMKTGFSALRGVSYQKECVQSSGSGEPPYIRLIERITALDDEITADIDRLADMKEQARGVMAGLPEQEQKVLTYRYLQGRCWTEVAAMTGCTVRHAHRLKRKAFANLETQDVVLAERNITTSG